MTKFPIMLYNTKNTKKALVPPIPPPSSYEDAVGWSAIEAGYKTALRGSRKFTREAVLYDLYSEVNNVRLWRDLKKIEKTRQAGVSEYTPGKYRHRIIVEPKERSLHIPPLRERREDIPPLCRSLLDELSRKLKRRLELTPEAMDRLLAHNWPGNVRELRNVLEFCAYLTPSGVITELSLPENLRTGPTAQPSLTLAQRTRAFERAEILRLLERNGASLEGKKKTAAQLGISLASLYNKLNMQF